MASLATWENGTWDLSKGDEIAHENFEDIRKWIWLLYTRYAGSWTVPTNIPDLATWEATYPVGAGVNDPASLIVKYYSELYQLRIEATNTQVHNNPPPDDGSTMNTYWIKTVNRNLYHHYDRNSGRHIVEYSSYTGGGYSAYTCELSAFKWLPTQTDPQEQVAPVQPADFYAGAHWYNVGDYVTHGGDNIWKCNTRHQGFAWNSAYWDAHSDTVVRPKAGNHVAFNKDDQTQSIISQWTRTEAPHPPYPVRLTEYHKTDPQPRDEKVSEANQYHYNPLMCEAYQDRIISCAETNGASYATAIDSDFGDYWEWWEINVNGIAAWNSPIVYQWTDLVSNGGDYYFCYRDHVSAAADEPGVGGDWEDYWVLNIYHPELSPYDPVYARLNDKFFKCNGSSYEKALKMLGQFDWYWDDTYPAVLNEHISSFGANFPYPAGCWRRTWRYSFKRAGTIMYVGNGDPPEYYPDKYCVSAADYATVAAPNQKYYKSMTVPPVVTLTDEQEAELALRHDPQQQIYDDDDNESDLFEIYADMVNDMHSFFSAFSQVGDVPYTIEKYDKDADVVPAEWDHFSATAQGTTDLLAADVDAVWTAADALDALSYEEAVMKTIAIVNWNGGDPPAPDGYYSDWSIGPAVASGRKHTHYIKLTYTGLWNVVMFDTVHFHLRWKPTEIAPLYMEIECDFNGDVSWTATPEDDPYWRGQYVDCPAPYPSDEYHINIVSDYPVPAPAAGNTDIKTRQCFVGIHTAYSLWCISDLDWNLVPASCFALDDSNVNDLR